MTLQLCGALIILILIMTIIVITKKNAKQSARLRELKRELDAIYKSQELASNVYSLSNDDARRRLQDIATKQRVGM